MKVGIPKEVHPGELRVAATPETVARIVKLGLDVQVQAGAGDAARFLDADYAGVGATIVPDAKTLWSTSDIILKVRPPTIIPDLGTHEADLLKPGAVLVGFIWPAQNKDIVEKLAARKATVLGMDCVPRITRAQKMDALSAMANIAGYRAIVEAAACFGRFMTGQVTAAGRVEPAKVFVVGAGVAGLAAVAAAKALGAQVRAFDTRPAVREQVESLGARFVEFKFDESGEGTGGYAKQMSDAYLAAEQALIAQHAKECDIIVTTALVPGKPAPQLVTSGAVVSMQSGSVIVDLAAEQGGNCALTERGKVVEKFGVTIIGFTDLPSRMARQSSELYATTLFNLLAEIVEDGKIRIDLEDEVERGALVLHEGRLTWPPPTPSKPRAAEPRPETKETVAAPALPHAADGGHLTPILGAVAVTVLGIAGLLAPPEFLGHLTVFLLACIVGWHVVWNVTPALHTPLMSVTNAISGIILIGGMLVMAGSNLGAATVLGCVAVLVASVNVAGGFLVTQRMLRMLPEIGGEVQAISLAWIAAGILFILSLRGLSSQVTARRGNAWGAFGMLIAVAATLATILLSHGGIEAVSGSALGLLAGVIVIGCVVGTILAARVAMTSMPELVAILHSFVGLAAVLVGFATYLSPRPGEEGLAVHLVEIYLGVLVGAVTFTGSVVAFGKLRGTIGSRPLLLPGRHVVNAVLVGTAIVLAVGFVRAPGAEGMSALAGMTVIAAILGVHLVMAIGGGDMPVVVSLLNSYSGWAASAAGFMLSNDLLIITGALVGSSGAILSTIMCRAMNRSIWNVVFGGFGAESGAKPAPGAAPAGPIHEASSEQVAALLRAARSVVVVPGYGMAVARAQHAVKELTAKLVQRGVKVRYAIHPVAGRLPGHMNVLLAEADVPYDIVKEMDEINEDLPSTDVVLVIGANDIVNPSALDDPASPIYGMPVIHVWRAGRVVMLKRGMSAGYAGVDNPLCYKPNTLMLFGDARETVTRLLGALA